MLAAGRVPAASSDEFIYKENYYKTESKNENTSHMQQKHKGDAYIPSTNNHVHKSIKN
jgi:hypothetical protein